MNDGILLPYKRKHIWIFEGKDKHGNIVFPKDFVKINERPNFPYSIEGKIFHPGEIILHQLFPEDKKEYENGENMQEGVLSLLNEAGTEVEKWIFKDIFQCNKETDDHQTKWTIEYNVAECCWRHLS